MEQFERKLNTINKALRTPLSIVRLSPVIGILTIIFPIIFWLVGIIPLSGFEKLGILYGFILIGYFILIFYIVPYLIYFFKQDYQVFDYICPGRFSDLTRNLSFLTQFLS